MAIGTAVPGWSRSRKWHRPERMDDGERCNTPGDIFTVLPYLA